MEYKEYRKELKRLSRTELLELMIEQSKELERVRTELADVRRKLDDRELRLNKAGSLAEASLALSKVFEAAQTAADEYLKAVRTQDSCSDEDWDRILDEAISRREAEATDNQKSGRKNRRNRRKNKIVASRTALKEELRQVGAKLPEAETPSEIQTTEARYSEAAETAAESTYYNNEGTEEGAVTVNDEADNAAEITETEAESTYYNNEETEADAVTVNDEALDESYEEAPDATEITETAEGSEDDATPADEREAAKEAEAEEAKEGAEETTVSDSKEEPSEGELIERDSSTGTE